MSVDASSDRESLAPPCVMVIFGASGDLTKRLLMPALYNLACDGLLPDQFAIVGVAMDDLTSEQFRERLSKDIRQFSTRKEFEAAPWDKFAANMEFISGKFDDPAVFRTLAATVKRLDTQLNAGGNVLFYYATPPSLFGLVSRML